MAAAITFFANGNIPIGSGSSGLGQYGSGGFGTSIPISSYNSYTYTTNSAGTTTGVQVNNTSYLSSGSGSINGSGALSLLAFPNYLMPVNIRFTNDTSVRTLNAVLRGYDRVSIDSAPSGCLIKAASIIHVASGQSLTGSGSSSWTVLSGSGSTLSMHTSPATSGLSPSGSSSVDVRHDWFAALSMTPTSTGSKNSAIYFSVDYL